MERSSWRCHCSLQPCNSTEFLDWVWSGLCFKWITGDCCSAFGGGVCGWWGGCGSGISWNSSSSVVVVFAVVVVFM